jgi:hypothetical protein
MASASNTALVELLLPRVHLRHLYCRALLVIRCGVTNRCKIHAVLTMASASSTVLQPSVHLRFLIQPCTHHYYWLYLLPRATSVDYNSLHLTAVLAN